MVQPTRLLGRIPNVLDVGNESGNDDDIFRTVSEGLVGDMDITAFGVSNFRRHQEFLRRDCDRCSYYGRLAVGDRVLRRVDAPLRVSGARQRDSSSGPAKSQPSSFGSRSTVRESGREPFTLVRRAVDGFAGAQPILRFLLAHNETNGTIACCLSSRWCQVRPVVVCRCRSLRCCCCARVR